MLKKQKEIITILKKSNGFVTGNELSTILGLSIRTIRGYIKEINTTYNTNIVLSSKNGYKLSSQADSVINIVLQDEIVPQTQEDRSLYILKMFITKHTQSINIYDFCDALYLSYTAVKSVIAKMNKSLSSHGVSLSFKNDFVYFNGSENAKRKIISQILYEESKNSVINIRLMESYFPDIGIKKILNCIQRLLKNNSLYMNDFAIMNLLLHLAIMIDRNKNGYNLYDTCSSSPHNPYEVYLLSDLLKYFESEMSITFTHYEISEISMILKSSINNINYNSDLKELVGQEVTDLVYFYVQEINHMYMINLSDSAFIIPFASHLKNLLVRIKKNKCIINPMTSDIKMGFPVFLKLLFL